MEKSDPSAANEVILSWARDLYAQVVDRKDGAGFAAAFTKDATLRFGNATPLAGRKAIEAAITQFFSTFAALRHESRGAWVTGYTLILEAVVTYTRHDERQVTIPAVTIFRLARSVSGEDGSPVADDCRIYVDLAPLYAPSDE